MTTQKQASLILSAFLILAPLFPAEGAKVLLLPMIAASHTINFAQLGSALVGNGHEVYAYVNGDCETTKRLTKAKVGLVTYNNTVGGCVMESDEVNAAATMSIEGDGFDYRKIYEMVSSRYPLFKAEVIAMLGDRGAIRKLKKFDFDVIVADGLVYNKHVYVIAYILNKPIVSMMSVFSPFEAGIPALPSLYMTINSALTDQMTFAQRLKNLGAILMEDLFLPAILPTCDNNLVTKYASERPYKSISQISSETKLWLVLSDNVIDYPKVTVPSIVNIGGLNTKPAEPLAGDMALLADRATEGLIIVSFGSQFVLPQRKVKILIDSFRNLKQRVIMRHTGDTIPDLPPNVHISSWIPQNNLLGHPNTRLFVTHCGSNGQFEALYHGVPMIGLPIIGDQMHNAKRAEYHGIAISLSLRTLTTAQFKAGITTMLTAPSYAARARHLSAVFRDRPLTPLATATHWVEHVIKYGGKDLRPVSVDLPSYQFWCLDLLLFVTIVVAVLCYVLSKFCCCLLGSCCGRKVMHKLSPESKLKTQ